MVSGVMCRRAVRSWLVPGARAGGGTMSRGGLRRFLFALGVVVVLLAGCGQESDLHQAAKPAPTATPWLLPDGKQPPPAPQPPNQGSFPSPVPTVPPPLATTT